MKFEEFKKQFNELFGGLTKKEIIDHLKQLDNNFSDTIFSDEAIGITVDGADSVIFNGLSKGTTVKNANWVIFNNGTEDVTVENTKHFNDNRVTMLNPEENLTEDKLIVLFGGKNKDKIDEFMKWYKHVVKFNTK